MTLSEALFLIGFFGMFFGLVWIAFRLPYVIAIALLMLTVYFTGNLNQYIPRSLWW